MGFMDNILKKVGMALATRYGVISSGKGEGCELTLGNPPKQKVSVANTCTEMVFIQNKEEVARLSIQDDIEAIEYTETIKFPKTGLDGYRCKITFTNGDVSFADIFPSQVSVNFMNSVREKMTAKTLEFFEKKTVR